VRRATAALLGTVTGTVLLVGAKYGTSPAGTNTGNTVAVGGPATSDGAAGADPAASASASPVPAGPNAAPVPGGSATRPAGGATTPAAGRTTTGGTPRTTPAAPPAPACRTATGNAAGVASPGIGTVTVTIKVCNGAITTSSGSQSASNWNRNAQAVPALNTLAVQYYKTDFSKIHYSGATLTSNAYQSSLRSAMSKAGI
jgi:uncharacterized protein with FMN-binding domain